MASEGERDPKSALCIDFGSTESRVVIGYCDNGHIETQVVENLTEAAESSVNHASHFSSKIYPFDNDPKKYAGHARQPGREASSFKFAPYVLVGTTEEMQEQYIVLVRLWREIEKMKDNASEKDLKKHLKDSMKQLTRCVLTEAKKALDVRKLDVLKTQLKTVAMTVPSQWDLHFQDLYEGLIKEVFAEVFQGVPQVATNAIDVVFHTEATALMHYMFNRSASQKDLPLGGGVPDINSVLGKPNVHYFVDLGGHNANGTLATYHRNKDNKAVLYEIDQPQGAGGGTEMWIQGLLNQLSDLYAENHEGEEMPLVLHQDLKDAINEGRRKIMSGADHCVAGVHPQGPAPVTFVINKEMSDKAFEAGFQHVKHMIRGQLVRLANIKNGWGAKDHVATIIVSGGSSLHPEFIKWMKALCLELSLPEALYTHKMEIQYGAARIAKGAAYATLTRMSVERFAEKCAFVLQKGRVIRRGEDDEHVEYEDSAETIWYQENGGTRPLSLVPQGDDAEYRIVCQPFLESFAEKVQTDQSMAEGSSYDFLNIGTLQDGYSARFEFAFDIEKKQVEFKISSIPPPTVWEDRPQRQAARKEKEYRLGPFPVHVQTGTLCLVIKQPTEDIDEHIENVLYSARLDSATKGKGKREKAYRGKARGSTSQPKTTVPRAMTSDDAAPKTAANINKNPTASASTPANEATQASSAGSGNASKTTGASAAAPAHMPSKAPSGNAVSDRRAASDIPTRTQGINATSDSRSADATKQRRKDNMSPSGEASSSKAPAAQVSTSTKKRPPPSDPEDNAYVKRVFQRSGFFRNVEIPPRQDASSRTGDQTQTTQPSKRQFPAAPRDSGRGLGIASSAGQRPVAPSPEAPRYTGSAFWGRDHPDASAPRHPHAPQPTNNITNDRPASKAPDYFTLKPPSRQAAQDQEFPFSDRRRGQDSEAPLGHTARRNPRNNVCLGRNRPIGRAPLPTPPPPPPPPPRDNIAAPTASPSGDALFRSLPIGSPRPDSGSHSGRNSGPTGSSRDPRDSSGFRPSKQRRNPPKSD